MGNPIRILHVLGRLDRGGAETMIMNLYRNIDRSKIQFDFVIHTDRKCDYNDEIDKLGGRIYNVTRYKGKNHFVYKREWHVFFNSHPEYKIIHGHMRSTASIYLSIAKQYGIKTIAHSHSTASRGNKIDQFVKNIMQFPIRFIADYLFACSEEAGKWLFGNRVLNNKNYYIIRNAIDIEKYTFNESIRNQFRKQYKIKDQIVMGHTGSFTTPKNHDFLIEVFNQVQKRDSSALLLLIGEGELKPQIEKKIKGLNLENKVILTGSVPNVNEYLQMMDIFVFPSIFEGLGIALIEAQAAGVKSIVADNLPNEVFITDLIERMDIKNNPQSWAKAILDSVNYPDINTESTIKDLRVAGYEITEQSKVLQNIYIDIINKMSTST